MQDIRDSLYILFRDMGLVWIYNVEVDGCVWVYGSQPVK